MNTQKLPTISFVILVVSIFFISSTGKIDDNCRAYFPMEKGSTFEITHFSAKDKKMSKVAYEVLDKIESGSSVTSTIKMTSFDKKDQKGMDGEFQVKCENGIFKMDMRSVMSGAQMQQFEGMEDMDIEVNSEDLELPSNMNIGDKLKDGSLTITVSGGAMTMFNSTTDITNRKVEAIETVTTSAGTFECYVISSNINSKMGFVKMQLTSKDWIAEGVGMVRQESYKNGKLQGYSELTVLNR